MFFVTFDGDLSDRKLEENVDYPVKQSNNNNNCRKKNYSCKSTVYVFGYRFDDKYII